MNDKATQAELPERAEAAYMKACESSQPQDWLDAALLLRQALKASQATQAPLQEPAAQADIDLLRTLSEHLKKCAAEDGNTMRADSMRTAAHVFDRLLEHGAAPSQAAPAIAGEDGKSMDAAIDAAMALSSKEPGNLSEAPVDSGGD